MALGCYPLTRRRPSVIDKDPGISYLPNFPIDLILIDKRNTNFDGLKDSSGHLDQIYALSLHIFQSDYSAVTWHRHGGDGYNIYNS